MSYLLYLMFRCDKRCDGCDGKFGNFVGTKHTHDGLTKNAMSERFLEERLRSRCQFQNQLCITVSGSQ